MEKDIARMFLLKLEEELYLLVYRRLTVTKSGSDTGG